MYIQFSNAKTGKVYFQIGKAPSPVVKTPEEVAEARRKIRAVIEKTMLEMMEPSSEEGRKLYYSRVGVFQTPFVILADLWHLFMNNEVWFSSDGRRVVRSITRIDGL